MKAQRWKLWRRWQVYWQGDWQLGEAPQEARDAQEVEVVSVKGLAQQVKAELHSDEDGTTSLAGPLGEAIANASGSYSLEFTTPEQVADGIVAWLEGGA